MFRRLDIWISRKMHAGRWAAFWGVQFAGYLFVTVWGWATLWLVITVPACAISAFMVAVNLRRMGERWGER